VTRGDGGQNLIGPEQAELLGLIRTQELLQARRLDGAEQFFTRANDFGFSKTTEEALKVWEHEKVLGDAVWTIRNLRPDVIITRFPPDSRAGPRPPQRLGRAGRRSLRRRRRPQAFSRTTQIRAALAGKRVVWNAYNPGFTNTPPEGPNVLPVQIGGYSPLLGKSYTEIAGESRSMHKSQGFGSGRARGLRTDYLKHTVGEPARNDLFDDVDLTWKRVKGAEALSLTLQEPTIVSTPKTRPPACRCCSRRTRRWKSSATTPTYRRKKRNSPT
jgi:hypothetical protein